MNYQVEGTTGFATHFTPVYYTSEMNELTYTLKAGEKVSILSNYSEKDITKIRYTDSDGKELIGFVYDYNIQQYFFPIENGLSPNVIITVSAEMELTDFVQEFISISNDYSVIGVYIDNSVSSVEEFNIEAFCEEQNIPWGNICKYSEKSYENYIGVTPSYDLNYNSDYSYHILPQAFDITTEFYLPKGNDFTECILFSQSDTVNFEYTSWITNIEKRKSPIRNTEIFKEESIYAYKFYENSSFYLSYPSDIWIDEIRQAYQEIENATHD